MKTIDASDTIQPGSSADRRMLTNGLTLIALGISILFLNSWNGLVVRTSVGLFWGMFFLILNWSSLVQAFRGLRQKNDRQRRSSYEPTSQWK
jgi:tetrahydromethanopterin S-methyltransferase subunit E